MVSAVKTWVERRAIASRAANWGRREEVASPFR
jgi:hypothetical protein